METEIRVSRIAGSFTQIWDPGLDDAPLDTPGLVPAHELFQMGSVDRMGVGVPDIEDVIVGECRDSDGMGSSLSHLGQNSGRLLPSRRAKSLRHPRLAG